jgi:hypothetical protein
MRSKRVAIYLALFLSFIAWLYTYKKDRLKFWAGFTLVATPAGIAAMSYLPGFVSASANQEEVSSLFTFSVLTGLSWSVFILWALFDAIRRPSSFYAGYQV